MSFQDAPEVMGGRTGRVGLTAPLVPTLEGLIA